ncbi:hypothetical protein HMPREF3213_02346 [Heyndrickxia coagulans]|uniref:Uncharacterized protein n=1 Tax=Heyndrickxia coagulans TaxID=1398 RepID=A0A133KL89_HEYCO|nr:hypothetical protein HMPREF3213_02346 [Heyndrickxia coagulans]
MKKGRHQETGQLSCLISIPIFKRRNTSRKGFAPGWMKKGIHQEAEQLTCLILILIFKRRNISLERIRS